MKLRILALGAHLFFMLGAFALAEETEAGQDPLDAERYQLEKTDDGFVRLDRETGNISLCRVRNSNLICRLSADERNAYEDEITSLNDRISALEKQVAEQVDRPRTEVPGKSPERSKLDKEFEKAMDFAQDAMRRFYDVVKELKQKYEDEKS